MRLFNYLQKRKTEWSIRRLYKNDIDENIQTLFPKAFEEHFSPGYVSPVVLKSELFSKKKPAGRTLSRYVMERRSSTRKQYADMTIVRSPWHYERIDAFYNKESYFSRSLIRQIETMINNKYSFSSDDPTLLAIVKKEIARIHMDSGMPFNRFLFSAAKSLLKYGIVIVQKVRESVKDDLAIDDKRKNRITRFRIIKPHNVTFFVNKKGRCIGVQEIANTFIANTMQRLLKRNNFYGIPAEDIMIAYMDDPGDDMFPEPSCYQMLDDILTLRSIEETIELLVFQFGSPLLHARVGTDELPASPEEVRSVNAELVSMSPNGMVTTDHRTTIDVVNLQKGITNLIPYLEHFKCRVLIGSGSSPLSIGHAETANRNTAESVDDALSHHCANLADALSAPLNYNLIPDLIVRAETPYRDRDLFNEQGELKIQIEFNDTKIEKSIAKVNNVINLWEGNLITLPEARRKLNLPPLSNKDELYVNIVQIPLKNAGGTTEANAPSSVSSKTRVQNQPQNQYGVKPGPGSRKD